MIFKDTRHLTVRENFFLNHYQTLSLKRQKQVGKGLELKNPTVQHMPSLLVEQ